VQTTVSILITKNADLTYTIVSGDSANAAGWVKLAGAWDYIDSFSSLKNLLMNEISDHLPVYSWGPYVQRAFELMADGYSLASTMHADTVDGVVEQLTDECDVPEHLIGHLALVAPIHVGASGGRRLRRISEVAVLEPLGGSYDRCTIAQWRPQDDEFDVLATPAQINAIARRLRMDDASFLESLGHRERFLDELLRDGADGIDDVQERILAFSGHAASRP